MLSNLNNISPNKMRKAAVITFAILAMVTNTMSAQNGQESVLPQVTLTVKLYPQGQNSNAGIIENGVAVTQGPGESNGMTRAEMSLPSGWIFNIGDSARMDIYLPSKEQNPCGQMAIVIPGGGYQFVSAANEGVQVAKWLTDHGIAACVLKYRLPNRHKQVPLTDVQNAFRYCRNHASQWGVSQIGIIGFSAGGHLAAYASNFFTDDITRPDFSILVYPVITLERGKTHEGTRQLLVGEDEELIQYYSMENRVTEKTPPTLLLLSADDTTVPPLSSLRYFEQLNSNNVPVQMCIFPSGGHGYGFTTPALGDDALGPHRELFFQNVAHFLNSVRE